MRSLLLAIVLLLGVAHINVNAQVILMPRFGQRVMNPFNPVPMNFPSPTVGAGPVGLGAVPYTMLGPNGPTLLPGFGADITPRMRPTVYPAIPLPSPDIIEAALGSGSDGRASLTIIVPQANAQVFMDGVRMEQSGIRRQFITPRLAGGSDYTLEVQVQWQGERGPQSRSRTVTVTPGGEQTITIR